MKNAVHIIRDMQKLRLMKPEKSSVKSWMNCGLILKIREVSRFGPLRLCAGADFVFSRIDSPGNVSDHRVATRIVMSQILVFLKKYNCKCLQNK